MLYSLLLDLLGICVVAAFAVKEKGHRRVLALFSLLFLTLGIILGKVRGFLFPTFNIWGLLIWAVGGILLLGALVLLIILVASNKKQK